ncbi:MAG: MoeA C-terminal region, partial [Pseudomonadota bacterium]
VESIGLQESHALSSFITANCYIVLPSDCNGVMIGENVYVEPFETFI